MRLNPLVFSVVFGCLAHAQPVAPPKAPSAAEDAARQRSVMAAMEESLARQRESVQKQPLQKESRGFFVLSPPAALGTLPAPISPVADCDPLPASQLDALIGSAAKRADLDESLLRSLMKQESGFRACAVSPKGAMGLMQLMPATADQFGVKHPFDPEENVNAGAKLLKQLLERYKGDKPLALGAYNAGAGAVDAADGVPHFRETLDYITRILATLPTGK